MVYSYFYISVAAVPMQNSVFQVEGGLPTKGQTYLKGNDSKGMNSSDGECC